jgi:hypothetical protein
VKEDEEEEINVAEETPVVNSRRGTGNCCGTCRLKTVVKEEEP